MSDGVGPPPARREATRPRRARRRARPPARPARGAIRTARAGSTPLSSVTRPGRMRLAACAGERCGRPSLLAILLQHPNAIVSTDNLLAELWGDAPPASADKSIHVYVSRLRKELGP